MQFSLIPNRLQAMQNEDTICRGLLLDINETFNDMSLKDTNNKHRCIAERFTPKIGLRFETSGE